MGVRDSVSIHIMGWIYKITSPCEKSYIGQTQSKDPQKRWKKHISKASGCRHVRNAIFCYGVENMRFETLYEISYETHGYRWKEFLNFWEKYEIAEEDTLNPRGYNLQTGGRNYCMTNETKQILREKATGRKASEETRRKLKKTPEQKELHRRLQTGKKMNQESKNKISARGKGRPKSEEHRAKIKAGQPVYTEERRQITISSNKKKAKRVDQFTLEGIFIKTHSSARAAAGEINRDAGSIGKCCQGKKKTCGGYTWKFSA